MTDVDLCSLSVSTLSASACKVRSAARPAPSVAAAQCAVRVLGRRRLFSAGVGFKSVRSCSLLAIFVALHAANGTYPAIAQSENISVSDGWVPAIDQVGGDVPLLMTVRNNASSPDALMRVRCPVANFSERHTVDRGEGAPAMRSIPSIPVAAGSTVVLKPNEFHFMLIQTIQPLHVGDRFKCSVAFQKAGTLETDVEVRKPP